MDAGLGIGRGMGLGTEFDTDNLLRMDSVTQMTVIKDAVGAGVMAPNEARAKLDLEPVDGGEGPYLQQQNYSLQALAKRDAQADPFAPNTPSSAPSTPQPPQPAADEATPEDVPKSVNPEFVVTRLFARAA
jgi:phage portal protein BeeE